MRNKLILLLALALFAFTSSTVFAATAGILAGGTSVTIGGGSFTPSTKVHMSVVSDGAKYGAASQHETGTKAYASVGGTGASADVSKIFTSDCAGSACGATAPTPTAGALPSGTWN